jgi:hypothetical protein
VTLTFGERAASLHESLEALVPTVARLQKWHEKARQIGELWAKSDRRIEETGLERAFAPVWRALREEYVGITGQAADRPLGLLASRTETFLKAIASAASVVGLSFGDTLAPQRFDCWTVDASTRSDLFQSTMLDPHEANAYIAAGMNTLPRRFRLRQDVRLNDDGSLKT